MRSLPFARSAHAWLLLIWILEQQAILPAIGSRVSAGELRAGAAAVDITPRRLPVIQSGGFIERIVDRVESPLYARALALSDGSETIAMVIVDSCMIPREVCDAIKDEAAIETGLRRDRILIAATHTHAAPSTMDYCLGSMQDRVYTVQMIPQVAMAIQQAVSNLEPAQIGWSSVDAWDYTNNRRWIKRSDRIDLDPFGQSTVRAMMHPNPLADYVGPSGPEDPTLTVLSVVRSDRSPIALFANFSMHYHGASSGIHADYFGKFSQEIESKFREKHPNQSFVALMSQGTSGDLHLKTYDVDQTINPSADMQVYAQEIAKLAWTLTNGIQYQSSIPIAMAERELELSRRLPDAARLAWAAELNKQRGDQSPTTRPEVYAMQADWIDKNRTSKLILQAVRIGDFGIATMPNEVFALTGLKIKRQSPLAMTMNMELANGADGYIPPPEQHVLGGYTTWPSRTAGLEVGAEPKIVDAVLGLLEEVAGSPRKPFLETHSVASNTLLAMKPLAFWRLNEASGPTASDASDFANDAELEDGIAFYLPGVGSRPGLDYASAVPELPNPFSGTQINRSMHFAGGRLHASLGNLSKDYSLSFWLWNGFPFDARPITGYMLSRGSVGELGDHLGICGSHRESPGKLVFYNGKQSAIGHATLKMRTWHHVAYVREGEEVRVYLDGNPTPDIAAQAAWTLPPGVDDLYLGGRCDRKFGFEGKLDEVAVFDRAISVEDVQHIFSASGRPYSAPITTAQNKPQPPISSQPALEPHEAVQQVHVPNGFRVDLVASEPQVLDPVAFDWDAMGRLWVVEMADYPLGMDGNGKAGGRVRVLEDLDRDGRYEKGTLFAEGLNFPNGILTWRDGVIVTAAPEILFLKDQNHDGKADVREVLVTGLSEGNQQLRPNGLRWGLDNWVYVASGAPGTHLANKTPLKSLRAGIELESGTMDFRFRPDSGELELESGPTQFGRSRDDWGHWFGTQNVKPLWHYVFAERYVRRNPFLAMSENSKQLLESPAPVYPSHPPEKRFHSYGQAGHYTSACAGIIHRDPKIFGDQLTGFVCEPFHNLTQQLQINDDGVTFSGKAITYAKHDFLTSTDRWFRPVMVRTGPDGALWVADMYRFMIEHPQFLPAEGKEAMLPRYRLGDDRGRIYRIARSDMPLEAARDLATASTEQLIDLLGSDNGFLRDKAHQLLYWQGNIAAVEQLRRAAFDMRSPFRCLHALCLLEGLGKLEPSDLVPVLRSRHIGLIENALRLSEPWLRRDELPSELLDAVISTSSHASAKVKFQAALTLGESSSPQAGETLASLLQREHQDKWVRTAVLTSATPHLAKLIANSKQSDRKLLSEVLQPLMQIAIGTNRLDAASDLLEAAIAEPRDGASIVLAHRVLDALQVMQKDLESLNEKNRNDQLGKYVERFEQMLQACLVEAQDDARPFAKRLDEALLASRYPSLREPSLRVIASWLHSDQPLDVQLSVIKALSKSGSEKVPEMFMGFWNSSGPTARNAMLEGWMTREAWALDLLTRLRKKQIPIAALDASHRTRLTNYPVNRIVNMSHLIFGESTSTRGEVIQRFQPALSLDGNPERGKLTYQKVCAACHRRGNEGVSIGPDMAAFVAHSPEKLLANILDPNIDIQPGFQAFICLLKSEEQIYGIVTQESSSSVTFKNKDGSERIVLRSEIETLKATNVSFMPEGLENTIDLQQMADLIAFLRSP